MGLSVAHMLSTPYSITRQYKKVLVVLQFQSIGYAYLELCIKASKKTCTCMYIPRPVEVYGIGDCCLAATEESGPEE